MSLGAGCLLLLPVDGKALDIEALTRFRLPLDIWSSRPQQIHLVVLPTGYQQFSVKIASIDEMRLREEVFLVECLMHDWGDSAVSDGS